MKNKSILVVLSILLLGILLTSCTGASTTNSWAGVTASDTAVYFTNGTSVLALNADSGTNIWTYPPTVAATRLFYAAPAIAGDQLIIGDYSGMLVGVGIRDGKELWQFTGAKGRYVDSPLVVNKQIIAQNADAKIYALDLTGNLQWTFQAKHAFWATPVSDGTTVFAPSLDHNLYALNLADGKLKWKADLGGPLVGRPTLAPDGTIYIGTLGNILYAINSADGSVKWQQKLTDAIWSAPVLLADRLYIGDQSGKISIVSTVDGSIIQSIDVQSAILGDGVVMNDNIVFGDEKGDIIVIGKNGERIRTPSITGKLYSNLVFNNNRLYVLTTKGDKPLYAYDANGTEIWAYSTSK